MTDTHFTTFLASNGNMIGAHAFEHMLPSQILAEAWPRIQAALLEISRHSAPGVVSLNCQAWYLEQA